MKNINRSKKHKNLKSQKKITFQVFETRNEALKFMKINRKMKLYGMDKKPYINKKGKACEGAKFFITATPKSMYRYIKKFPTEQWYFYEYWISSNIYYRINSFSPLAFRFEH